MKRQPANRPTPALTNANPHSHPEDPMHTRPIETPRGRAGFTLIEILLVVVIIGMLATIVAVNVPKYLNTARVNKAWADVDSIGTSIEAFNMTEGKYPKGLTDLTTGEDPYIPAGIPRDPWGNEYQYAYPGSHKPFKYDLKSTGEDGVDSDDDIANYNKNKDTSP